SREHRVRRLRRPLTDQRAQRLQRTVGRLRRRLLFLSPPQFGRLCGGELIERRCRHENEPSRRRRSSMGLELAPAGGVPPSSAPPPGPIPANPPTAPAPLAVEPPPRSSTVPAR